MPREVWLENRGTGNAEDAEGAENAGAPVKTGKVS